MSQDATPTPPVDNLTTTQAHVLRYMRAHFAQEHELPSCLDIADAFGYAFGYANPNAAAVIQHASRAAIQHAAQELHGVVHGGRLQGVMA
jgi:hypothetical protein